MTALRWNRSRQSLPKKVDYSRIGKVISNAGISDAEERWHSFRRKAEAAANGISDARSAAGCRKSAGNGNMRPRITSTQMPRPLLQKEGIPRQRSRSPAGPRRTNASMAMDSLNHLALGLRRVADCRTTAHPDCAGRRVSNSTHTYSILVYAIIQQRAHMNWNFAISESIS